MPDLWVDVDANVIVPVNIMPLIDDTDFKTIETAVVYNSAGLALTWNFQTTAGVVTGTAVTPTTGGVYDWSEPIADKGMYAIEIPASGGASINNDTEGVGWFTGVATGVLPWRGPTIGFRASGLNDALIDSAYSATRGLAGTALPAAAADAAGGLPISDAGGLDLDARLDAAVTSRLAPTVAGRTLDVSATGEAGLDWANIGSPTTAQNLSATNIDVDQIVASVSGAVGSVTGLTAANLDATISSRATPAQVNTEVNDVINVDTKAELAGVPAANASLGDKMTFLEMKIRNQETQTATDATISNDAGTVIATAPVSDDGVTFTKGEYA